MDNLAIAKKAILVPVDFSLESIQGLRTAFGIARNISCGIILLHVIHESELREQSGKNRSPGAKDKDSKYKSRLISQKTEFLRGLRIQYHIPKVPIAFKVLIDPDQQEIEDLIGKHRVSLIVTGTNGLVPDNFSIQGLTIENQKKLGVPVLAVNRYNYQTRFDKLLMEVDFSGYDEMPIRLLQRFTELLNMRLFIAHMKEKHVKSKKSVSKSLNQFMERAHFTNYTLIANQGIDSNEQLERLAVDNDVDLIVTPNKMGKDVIMLHSIEKSTHHINWEDSKVLSII